MTSCLVSDLHRALRPIKVVPNRTLFHKHCDVALLRVLRGELSFRGKTEVVLGRKVYQINCWKCFFDHLFPPVNHFISRTHLNLRIVHFFGNLSKPVVDEVTLVVLFYKLRFFHLLVSREGRERRESCHLLPLLLRLLLCCSKRFQATLCESI